MQQLLMAAEGLTTIKSHFGPTDTMNRLEAEVKTRGMTLFAHIPHAKGAAAVGIPLRPNDLSDIRQCQGRNATDAIGANDWHRFAAEGFGMAGR